MITPSKDAELIIIGAGPAGCAAALMAASLGVSSLLIEADAGRIGGKLNLIKALENAPGGWTAGTDLAEALQSDIARISNQCRVLTGTATAVAGCPDRVEVALADGRTLTGETAIVATGVRPMAPDDTTWITSSNNVVPPPLWRASPAELTARTVVLGADRPLGTWLRGHPEWDGQLDVLHPARDDYKTAEVSGDARVRFHRVETVKVASSEPTKVTAFLTDGTSHEFAADAILLNLGTAPTRLAGLVQDPDGYCPPDAQHPRVVTAGDMRSARYQRIVTAQGSGAEAALRYYYGASLPLKQDTPKKQ